MRPRTTLLIRGLSVSAGMMAVAVAMVMAIAAAFAAAGQAAPPATTPGFDINALDRKADPCSNFYQFACGGWLAANPIPSDESRWGRFNELADRNREALHQILETASKNDPGRSPVDRMIGDYYAACMDESGIEAKGTAPLKTEMDRIAALKTPEDLAKEIANLHEAGVNVLFRARSQQDFKDATQVNLTVDQGGLGLPDRDSYLKDDPKSAETRGKYLDHVEKMLTLLGEKPEDAAAHAKTIMDIETALAKASLERVKRRDPVNIYHPMKKDEMVALASNFSWNVYFENVKAPPVQTVNVAVPDFMKGMGGSLDSFDMDAWKTYLRWHVLHDRAELLPASFVNENFDFYGKTLTGAKELRPRWKRCVAQTDQALGEALGQRYVEKTFGPQGKERTRQMVIALEKALEKDIQTLPWMTETTKKRALEKLAAIDNKIGHPDTWRDYSSVVVRRDDALGNGERAARFEVRRQLAKIGKPVDKKEWVMSPPTVNAYYQPSMNNINFPAGILQPPFYDNSLDDAVNFGGIGAVIGHELTHGFDDQGRKFDPAGNLNDWWTADDGKEFETRATCIADEYGSFTAVEDVKLNGRLTLGENTADNGGLRIAYMAMKDTIAGKKVAPIDGFTPEQRFFLGWGQIWCQSQTDENARLLAQVDPHSPGRYRVEGVVSNMPEFQQAFSCKAGSPMVRANACRVW